MNIKGYKKIKKNIGRALEEVSAGMIEVKRN